MKKIKNITIVGGGSAAWLAATYLQNNFWNLPVTVIDKEVGNPIGVGEATVLTFPHFLRKCGINLPEWFKNIDATYKAGIEFPHWKNPNNTVWHPFYLNRSYMVDACTQYDVWANNQQLDFKKTALPTYDVNMANKLDMWGSFETLAYHIDAGKLVKELQRICHTTVKTIKSDVVKVNKDYDGNIISLELKNGMTHHSDFYIDCTGFASILKEAKRVELLGNGRLFTNAAVAGHVPYEDFEKECVPYVKCPAVDHGWIWKIPVQSRIGSGLVFNKDITDPEEAKRYFCEHWDNRIKPEDLKLIDWVPYYSKNFWEGNVVSIGLSGGFIEPLESTGLSCMIKGIKHLEERIRIGYTDQNDRNYYNTRLGCYYENAIDFVNMHYSKTELSSKFWDYVKENHTPSDYQLWMEDVMRDPGFRNHVAVQTQNTNTIFHPSSWFAWMAQFEFEFNPEKHSFKTEIAESKLLDFYAEEQARKNRCVDHKEYIESFGGLKWK